MSSSNDPFVVDPCSACEILSILASSELRKAIDIIEAYWIQSEEILNNIKLSPMKLLISDHFWQKRIEIWYGSTCDLTLLCILDKGPPCPSHTMERLGKPISFSDSRWNLPLCKYHPHWAICLALDSLQILKSSSPVASFSMLNSWAIPHLIQF